MRVDDKKSDIVFYILGELLEVDAVLVGWSSIARDQRKDACPSSQCGNSVGNYDPNGPSHLVR